MKKFEYVQLYLNINSSEAKDTLNIFGERGWELISIIDTNNIGNDDYKNFFLKRPLKIIKNEKTK